MTKRKPKSEWEPRSPFAMTDAEIAERLGISRQRVDQIEREAAGRQNFSAPLTRRK